MNAPKTLTEAVVYFSDPERAFVYAVNLRWPDRHVTCPRCGGDKHSFIKTRRLWFCKGCKKQFTVKVGTIFEDSALGLDKWMTAIWMIVNCKNGISSHELGRVLGITQKSAWFMLHRIRTAMKGENEPFGSGGGTVEADETYIGPNPRKMHKDRKAKLKNQQEGYAGGRAVAKTIVAGMIDRDLRKVRASVVPDVRRETLQEHILNHIAGGARVMTDDLPVYRHALKENFTHEFINHLEGYVRGQVHTNGIENFWSLLKRGLRGTYVAVEPFHLGKYVDEQVFRYNNRGSKELPVSDAHRFARVMAEVAGRRLTYAELTGKNESPRHSQLAN